MKKIILTILVLALVGCSKKSDIVCTEKTDFYTTHVDLYFTNDELTKAISISEYEEVDLAKQICNTLSDKVKCYENKIEILNYLENYMGSSKYDVIEKLESQGLTCK